MSSPIPTPTPTPAGHRYVELARERGVDPDLLEGLERFPRPKDEAWKYTRAERFLREPYVPSGTGTGTGTGSGFEALNAAFADELVVDVPAGASRREVLEHAVRGDHRLATPRRRIRVGEGAELVLIERFTGTGPALTVAVTDLDLARGARVHHLRVTQDALHVGYLDAVLADDAVLRTTSIVAGPDAARVELRVRTEGRATAELAGLVLLRGEQHADHHVVVDHAAPNGTSRQQFRSLLDDKARSVFTGRVVVHRDAQKTDSTQVHRALLLSEGAIVNARPQLEISADDVKCAHGAAIGSLDPEALFYLQQRGLDPGQARALLTTAFAGDVLATVPAGEREALEALVARYLAASDEVAS